MIRDVHECNPVTRRDWVDSRRGPGLSFGTCPVEQPRTLACRRREVERPVETNCGQEPVAYSKYLNHQNRESPLVSGPESCTDSPRLSTPERSPECRASDDHNSRRLERQRRPEAPRLADFEPIQAVRVERRLLTVYRIVLQSRPGRMIDIFA